jgi:hypothetical protein
MNLILYTLANWYLLLTQTCFHSSIDLFFYLQSIFEYLGLGYSTKQFSPVRLIYTVLQRKVFRNKPELLREGVEGF